ncbi:GyrI-like domain-containing protein [Sanguibacter sp. 25GB23B1]|uniref:GyrI-like domain-containing protein n=1 Tax=unclassified Sanguibacter TaxID=2645534 RepID=UPI0032AFC9EB
MFEIMTREIAEQLVLTERSHVFVDRLPDWIGAALGRQHGALASAGSPADLPSFVAFHGEVSDTADGPVEACTPLDPEVAARVDLSSRVEPAHREVYTTITRAQLSYPEILAAYAAVETWVQETGESIVGPPREVYFTDVMAAGPHDAVADVAFPIAR